MDWLATILTSNNFWQILIGLVIILALLAVLSKKGFFRFQGKGLTVGRSENEIKLSLERNLEWTMEYVLAEREQFISELAQQNIVVNKVYCDLVYEKVYDLLVETLLLNNISRSPVYLRQKTLSLELLMKKMWGIVDSNNLQSPTMIEAIRGSAARLAAGYIDGILVLKELQAKQ